MGPLYDLYKKILNLGKAKIFLIFVIVSICVYILINNSEVKTKKSLKKRKNCNDMKPPKQYKANEVDYDDPDHLIKLAEESVKLKQYSTAIKLYNRCIELGDTRSYFHLAELYYSLTEGDYESDSLMNAVHYYKLAIENGYIECLLTLGDIYNYYDIVSCESDFSGDGRLDGLIPSKQIAFRIYKKIINHNHTSSEAKITANERIDELLKHANTFMFSKNKIMGYNNPNNFGREDNVLSGIDNRDNNYVNTLTNDNMSREKELEKIAKKAKEAAESRKKWETENRNNPNLARANPDALLMRNFLNNVPNDTVTNVVPIKKKKKAIRNDPQNVHESTVVKTLNRSLDRIRGKIDRHMSVNLCLKEIRDYIKDCKFEHEDKEKAVMTLDACERNHKALLSNNTKESDALKLVWSRIHHKDNRDRRKDLKDNLVRALSDSVERGGPVCASGRMTHIVSALDKTDVDENLVSIKPEWAIKEEIGSKVAKVRQDILNSCSKEEREAYEKVNPDKEEMKKAGEIQDRMKSRVKQEFTKDYIDTMIMTQDKLDVVSQPYIDAL